MQSPSLYSLAAECSEAFSMPKGLRDCQRLADKEIKQNMNISMHMCHGLVECGLFGVIATPNFTESARFFRSSCLVPTRSEPVTWRPTGTHRSVTVMAHQ